MMKRQHPDNPELFWCPKCQTYKARGEFGVEKGRPYDLPAWCKHCAAVLAKNRRISNPERQKEINKKSRLKNIERVKEREKQYRLKNRDKCHYWNTEWWKKHKNDEDLKIRNSINARRCRKQHIDEFRKKNRDRAYQLPDYVIRSHLKRSHDCVRPEMIELKRQQIIMKRTLKQFKEWRKEHESNHTDVQGEQRENEETNEWRQTTPQPGGDSISTT